MALVNIAGPKHCDYIVNWLVSTLAEANIRALRYTDPGQMPVHVPGKSHNIVIAPQVFQSLPSNYSVFQVEQLTSSRWLTKEYLDCLRSASYILDYSTHNLQIIRDLGIDPRRLFYCPIGVIHGGIESLSQDSRDIPFLFYGDTSSHRRQRILQSLSKHIDITICSEVFGRELESLITRAKYVLNIHYYDHPLLETTRISQCISLGARVITEPSLNDDEYASLYKDHLIYLDLDRDDALSILAELSRRDLGGLEAKQSLYSRLGIVSKATSCHSNDLKQAYYVFRFLLESGLIDYRVFEKLAVATIDPSRVQGGVVLTLPESSRYKEAQLLANRLGLSVYHGIKYNPGWRGCALSYKFIARVCILEDISALTCLEDDCDITSDNFFSLKLLHVTARSEGMVDIVSGIVSDMAKSASVQLVDLGALGEFQVLQLNRAVSMVCNIYESASIQILAEWPTASGVGSLLTIDRWLELHDVRCITTVPFLANQDTNLMSTIWNNGNDSHEEMIVRSESRAAHAAIKLLVCKQGAIAPAVVTLSSSTRLNALFILEKLKDLYDNHRIYESSEERLPEVPKTSRLAESPSGSLDLSSSMISQSRTWRLAVFMKRITPGFYTVRSLVRRLARGPN